ncbi:MAG: uroporphyrinogen-III synthase [Aquificae bacterium]|nr:uroporphyrinogen-III synthase [Aquificota bacterium]
MKVLITREESQAKKTAKLLEREGFVPVLFPVIRFEPVDFDISVLERADAVVFTSQNGVRFLFQKIEPSFLKGKTVVATGEKTKKALEGLGFEKVLVPEVYTGKGVGEMLVKDGSFHGKRVVFVRPVEGVDEGLKAVEGYVEAEALPVYRTVENYPPNRGEVEKLLKGGQIGFVIFTSPSTFRGFVKNFPENWRELLSRTEVCVIGSTTKKAVEKEGVKPSVVPEKFTVEALIKAIRQRVS